MKDACESCVGRSKCVYPRPRPVNAQFVVVVGSSFVCSAHLELTNSVRDGFMLHKLGKALDRSYICYICCFQSTNSQAFVRVLHSVQISDHIRSRKGLFRFISTQSSQNLNMAHYDANPDSARPSPTIMRRSFGSSM